MTNQTPPPGDPAPVIRRATVWNVFAADARSFARQFDAWFDPLMDWLLAYTRSGAFRRLAMFVTLSLVIWFGMAVLSHPPGRGTDPIQYQLLQALFSADVLRRALILWLALWLGTELAAAYLDDIFELDNLPSALRFIWAAAFLGGYPTLTIRDGDVASEHKDSPVHRIGGPGWVDVHLENVAVFERIDGTAHVISPEHQSDMLLDGFERLRSVIDLRDQVIELTVTGRTQDGISVTAKDVRLVYSVDRGFSTSPAEGSFDMDSVQHTYPFSEQAVLHLVYHHGPDPLYEAMRSLIRSELSRFISRHTLGEFLANALPAGSPDQFVPRDEITGLFFDYAQEFTQHAEEHGVRLQWIGVGTWITPAQIIPERHMEAWRLSSDARMNTSEGALEAMLKEARLAELLRLVCEVPSIFSDLIGQEQTPDQILRGLALAYREKLTIASELYANQGQPVPLELQRAVAHLSVLLAVGLENDRPS